MNIEAIKEFSISTIGTTISIDETGAEKAGNLLGESLGHLTTLLQAYEKQEKKIDQLTQEGNARAWDDRTEDLQSRLDAAEKERDSFSKIIDDLEAESVDESRLTIRVHECRMAEIKVLQAKLEAAEKLIKDADLVKLYAKIKRLEGVVEKIMEGDVKMLPYDEANPLILGKKADLSNPEIAYAYGWEGAVLECGEILAQALTTDKTKK